MISVIDYGMGNLWSVSKGLERAGAEVKVTTKANDILISDGVVLPGVGAFHRAMENLEKTGIIPAIHEVIKKRIPFFGICLGYQLLFEASEEGGGSKGLGVLKGTVKRFKGKIRIPQMGWNEVSILKETPLLKAVQIPLYMYFAHSFYVEPGDPDNVAAQTFYGKNYASLVSKDNVYGIQPHPEKSGEQGLKILKNFCETCTNRERN